MDKILFNEIMHSTVKTGLYGISNLRWDFSMFQHSKRIRWLQVIIKMWVIKVCTRFMWLMIRYGSGFCKCKEYSFSRAGTQTVQIFQNDTDGSGFQSYTNKGLLIPYFNQQNALMKIQ